MTFYKTYFFLLFISAFSFSQTFLDADNSVDAYNRITVKGLAYEVPDCGHPVKHITMEWNKELKKFAFVFAIHSELDDDRCINFDRQRNEIKTYNSSADSLKGFLGETMTFRWKFRLDSLFQPSPNFTHIHQIKPGDGINQDNPVITLTARYKTSGNKIQLMFISPDSVTSTVAEVSITPFLGVWVEAYEKMKFSNNGTYNLVIRTVNDGTVLLNYSNNNIGMWRNGSTFMRPKWGIYRSLNSISYLRDELVRFNDFSMDKGTLVNLPAAPSGLNLTNLSEGRIKLQWTDNSANEDQFRVERSLDSLTWQYLAPAAKNITTYTDTVVSSTIYWYRVRAENTFGNSGYSNTVKVSNTVSIDEFKENLQKNYVLDQNYPNPFNPVTVIRYSVPTAGKVKITVYNTIGNVVKVLVDETKEPGLHEVTFNASDLSSGIYFCRLQSDKFTSVKKMILIK